MMNRRHLLMIVFCLAVALVLSGGCSPKDDLAYPGIEAGNGADNGEENTQDAVLPSDGENGDDADTDDPEPPGTESPPQPSTVRIALYFTDLTAIDDEAPGETGYLKRVTRDCPYTLQVLRLSMDELIRGPLPEDGNVSSIIPAETTVNRVSIENGVALIDFSEELLTSPNSPGSSFGGGLFMQTIVYTATQFESVERVLVTVNGEPWSEGHYIWEDPIGRDEVSF